MSLKAVVLLSFASVIGLTLLVLGCALPEFGSWWPLFVLVFYFLAPLPVLISRNVYGADFNATSPCLEFALFCTSAIVLSAFALPFVLAHAGAIQWSAFGLITMASVTMFSTIFAWFRANYGGDYYGGQMF